MNEIKEAQQITVELLKKFVQICEKNNLHYFVSGGSLIGVMRHKGFIPWDDDVDVVMPRDDFNRFVEIMHKNENKDYGLCDRFTDKNWKFDLCQFIDNKTEIEIDLAKEKRKAHIWIDIFPLDGLPNSKVKRWLRVKHIMFLRYKVQVANINKQVDSHRNRPWYEKVILKICQFIKIEKIINTNKTLDKLEKLLMKSNYGESKYVGNMLGRYRENEVVLKDFFGTPKKGKFESIEVSIPEKSHELLTALYGDYMKLPPVEKRESHNVRIIKR